MVIFVKNIIIFFFMDIKNIMISFLLFPFFGQGVQAKGEGSDREIRNVGPLIIVTWDQGCFYNEKCPVDTSSGTPCFHTFAGSGAVAMAQIMKYYNYPAHGYNSHTYTLPGYGTLYADFSATTYDWLNMPQTLTGSNGAVSTLIYHCGVGQDMNYGPDSSFSGSALIDSAFRNYFGYSSSAVWKWKADYPADQWLAMIRAELDAGRPLLYYGNNGGTDEKFFICDGYQGTDSFHFNWGAGGSDDGYFYLTGLTPGAHNYTFAQGAIFNLSPALSAGFTANKTSIRAGENVNFSDESKGNPSSWTWSFPGGNPFGSNQQNPSNIRYDTPGIYNVTLKISDGSDTDSLTKYGYITVTGFPSYMSLDFESLPDFTLNFNPWSVFDINGGNTYGIDSVSFPNSGVPMAFICFNPSQAVPPPKNMAAHAGSKFGACFSSSPPHNPNNKWLISPRMTLGNNPSIRFWVQTYNTFYGLEKYNIGVSTTGNNPASFILINSSPQVAPAVWTKQSFSLSAYTGQDVYIGINCVSDTAFVFMIDDIEIGSALDVDERPGVNGVTLYPNPAGDHVFVSFGKPEMYVSNMMLLNETGTILTEFPINRMTGEIFRIPLSGLSPGLYYLLINSAEGRIVKKIAVMN
jgi:PKD repeat protein